MAMNRTTKRRCAWVPLDKPDYVAYHDHQWGRPAHDDRVLFEMLILEGAQAGLSWYTILQRREGYRQVFKQFDPARVAKMTDVQLKRALEDKRIIRNRLKVYATRKNAQVFIGIQKEFGSFDRYLRGFVPSKPIVHRAKSLKDIPHAIPESEALSKGLKKRGMSFVGGGIIYSFMQAVGLVDDHMLNCYLAKTKS